MSVLDGPLRRVASTLVTTFGKKSLTLTHTTAGSYNPSTGTSGPTTTAETVTGVVGKFTAGETGDTIRETDIKLTLAASDLDSAPDTDDTVTLASTVYQVVSVQPTYSGDEVATYVLALRR